MPSLEHRSLFLPSLLLAGLLIGLPWAAGGRSPIGQVSLVLVLVLAGVAGILGQRMSPLAMPSPLLLAAGVLATGSALHTIYSDRTIQSLLLLLAYLLAGALAADAAREDPKLEHILLTAILVSGMLVTTVSLYWLLHGSGEGLYAPVLTGPFGYPNAMTGFLLLAGGAALATIRGDRNVLVRVVALVGGVLIAGGILLTGSRGGLMAAIVGLCLWATIERRNWWPRRPLWLWMGTFTILAGIIGIGWSGGRSLLARWRFGNPFGDSSLLWRWQILQWTWEMVRDHPWWGVGPGAFPVALTHYQRIPYVSSENPHNLFLELAAEYGLPAAILALFALVVFLGRVGMLIRRAPDSGPARRTQTALLATLTAFAIHSLVDLDWSFPAIAATFATMLGLTLAHLQRGASREVHARPLWRGALIVLLLAAAFLSITRYYASTLVAWARLALSNREPAVALQEVSWALRLNPVSFPAHQSLAWARLFSGDPRGAAEVAERAIRIAPFDPNSHYLAGEIAAASGQWSLAEDRFRAAVDLAPSAQLRFHAALVDSAVNSNHAEEARFLFDRASSIFTEERVLNAEARCLMPGDRYVLARMSRVAAQTFRDTADSSRQQEISERARLLAQPDLRGICVARGRTGQTSPEAAIGSFWEALSGGGWPLAEQFLSPRLRASRPKDTVNPWRGDDRPQRAHVTWIAALQGGELQANLRFEVEFEIAPNSMIRRCAQADTQLIGDNWFVDRLSFLEPVPCQL